MLLNRTPIHIVFSLCLITIYILFNIKDSVMTIRAELREVSKQIQYEFDSIHLLKAELAYLTAPDRLKDLNDEYLKLKDTKVSQMVADPLKDNRETYNQKIASSKLRKVNTGWRYKKGPSKYLTMASRKK